jgi:hypothetical protein
MKFRISRFYSGTAIFLDGSIYKIIARRGKKCLSGEKQDGMREARGERRDNNTISGVPFSNGGPVVR